MKVNAHTHMRFEAAKYIPDRVLPGIGTTFIQGSIMALLGSLVSLPCAPDSMFFPNFRVEVELRLKNRKLTIDPE